MWSSNYQSFELNSRLNNTRKGFGVLPTWPTIFPFLGIPIDHCLISQDFAVESILTGKDIGSDHLPLVVQLLLKNNESIK